MSKIVVHPCDLYDEYYKKWIPIFCKIEFTGGNLSISGVIGPKRDGNAYGGCGQIDMEFDHKNKEDNDSRYSNPIKAEDLKFSDGWNKTKWYKFLEIWKHYHLNNMKSACEHQEKFGWNYESHRGMFIEAKNAKRQDEYNEVIALLETSPQDYEVEGEYGERYKLSDDGKLLKYDEFHGHHCPICGYSIGSSWLRREIPQDVIEFLNSLPDTDQKPAWV